MLASINDDNKVKCGEYLVESHNSLRDLYEVSCKEIDFLINNSMNIDGWYGGRIMGGGFGGQVINLIESEKFKFYKKEISNQYFELFNIIPTIQKINFVKGAETIF